MREALNRNRGPIGVVALVAVLVVSAWLHYDNTRPFYNVAAPYPVQDQAQVASMCGFTAISWVATDQRYNPLVYCRCILEHIEAHADVDQFKTAIRDAKSRGQTTDQYSAAAFASCNKRLGVKTAG